MKTRRSGMHGYGPGAWRMIGRGIELGAIIGGLTYLGYLGDARWGTWPWLTFAGAVLATVGGCYNLAKDMLLPKKKTANPPSTPEQDHQGRNQT